MQRRIIISAITILCLVCGCNKVPRDVIAPEIMENLLIDIHKAEAYMENNYSKFQTAANKDSVKASVYAKHNVSKADFDTSIIWYGANLEEFIEIYNKVIERLQQEDNELLALMNNQTDAYTGITRSGDTVNIWNISNHYIFEGNLNNNILTFSVPHDDNFKDGDLFKLKFKIASSDKGLYKPTVVLATKEGRDSTRYIKKTIKSLGWDSVELKSEKTIRMVMGSIFIPASPQWKTTYMDSISLERIHTK